jgi:uncharacterized protein YjdB
MRVRPFGTLAVAVGLVMVTLACGQSTTAPTTMPSLAVAGSTVAVGQTAQLKATTSFSGNPTQDVTTEAVWQSANTSVATVSATGVVTGVAPGTTMVTATCQLLVGSAYQPLTGSAAITVTP